MDDSGGRTGRESVGGDLLFDLFPLVLSESPEDGPNDDLGDLFWRTLLDDERGVAENDCSNGFGSRSKSARFWFFGDAERSLGDMTLRGGDVFRGWEE